MPIEINPQESTRFGMTAARLLDDSAPLARVNAAAAALGVDMITARVDSHALHRVQALEQDGYRLMDTLVYYDHPLGTLPAPAASPPGELIRPAGPDDATAAAEIAGQAFAGYFGHYHSDPRLSKSAADAVYVDWARSSIARTSARSPALVAVFENRLAGFLTLELTAAEIILNAVHPDLQQHGIYGRLIDHALVLARDAGCRHLSVSTQINNIAVQKAWGRRGFRMARSRYTLHKWFT